MYRPCSQILPSRVMAHRGPLPPWIWAWPKPNVTHRQSCPRRLREKNLFWPFSACIRIRRPLTVHTSPLFIYIYIYSRNGIACWIFSDYRYETETRLWFLSLDRTRVSRRADRCTRIFVHWYRVVIVITSRGGLGENKVTRAHSTWQIAPRAHRPYTSYAIPCELNANKRHTVDVRHRPLHCNAQTFGHDYIDTNILSDNAWRHHVYERFWGRPGPRFFVSVA